MRGGRGKAEIVRAYLSAIESGCAADELKAFFTDNVVQEEFPNRLVPDGATRDLAGLLEAHARGKAVLRGQQFEVQAIVEDGDTVAVEAAWTGTLAVPFGSIPAGGQMTARFAIFLEFQGSQIARQRNYDCFPPF